MSNLGRIWDKITNLYIARSTLRVLLKHCMMGHNILKKVMLIITPKSYVF